MTAIQAQPQPGEQDSKPDASTMAPARAPPALWRPTTFGDLMSIVQSVALIVGIAIAVYQTVKLREAIDTSTEAIDTSTWSALAAQLTEVDKQFVDHPELVPYFYDGKVLDHGDPAYAQAYSLGILVIDFMDSATVMGKHIDPSIFEPDAWERFYQYQFTQSPLICEIITDEAAIYGKRIVELGARHCAAAAKARRDLQAWQAAASSAPPS